MIILKEFLVKDKSIKIKAKKIILKIIENPEIGKPMMYSRKGTRELYIKPFRLSYSRELYIKPFRLSYSRELYIKPFRLSYSCDSYNKILCLLYLYHKKKQ